MHDTLDYVWGCFHPTTKIGHYSANGKPDHFPEGSGRDTKLDFTICYGDGGEVSNVKDACEKARQKLKEMGAVEIKPITAGHP